MQIFILNDCCVVVFWVAQSDFVTRSTYFPLNVPLKYLIMNCCIKLKIVIYLFVYPKRSLAFRCWEFYELGCILASCITSTVHTDACPTACSLNLQAYLPCHKAQQLTVQLVQWRLSL